MEWERKRERVKEREREEEERDRDRATSQQVPNIALRCSRAYKSMVLTPVTC